MVHKNRIGNLFSLTSFGESHGQAIGGVVDGMPAGVYTLRVTMKNGTSYHEKIVKQ